MALPPMDERQDHPPSVTEAANVETLIPHRWPMRLVEAVIERGADWIRCRGRVPADSPMVSGGQAPAILALELAAQSAALLEALLRSEREGPEEGPRLGYLVSVQDALLAQPTIPAGVELVALVRQAGGAAALARYEATVTTEDDARTLGTGILGTYALPPGAPPPGS